MIAYTPVVIFILLPIGSVYHYHSEIITGIPSMLLNHQAQIIDDFDDLLIFQ